MKFNLKKILAQTFCTKIGWLVICFLCAFVFVILNDFYDWAWIGIYASMAYPVILILVMITYGWIINPIKNYKLNKKLRDGNK